MSNAQRATDIAQLSDPTEAFHAIYTDADMMKAWLSDPAMTPGARMRRAHGCLYTAKNPCFKFGLEKEDTAEVIPMILAAIAALRELAAPMVAEMYIAKDEGEYDGYWYKIFAAYARDGYEQHDGGMLGIPEWS